MPCQADAVCTQHLAGSFRRGDRRGGRRHPAQGASKHRMGCSARHHGEILIMTTKAHGIMALTGMDSDAMFGDPRQRGMPLQEAVRHASPGAVIIALHRRQSIDEQQRIIDLLQAETNAARDAEILGTSGRTTK